LDVLPDLYISLAQEARNARYEAALELRYSGRGREENAKGTYVNISFTNLDIFSEIVLFYSSATSYQS